jgi:hypothetical protein
VADMTDLRRKVENRGQFIAQRLSLSLKEELRYASRHHRRTGRMEDTIVTPWRRTGLTTWRVEAKAPTIQAATTNKGARPHVIEPRKGQALRWSSGGTVIFARRVNHPGNKGDHWFDKVMTKTSIRSILYRFVGR